jgi:Rod binding domain-containing protein
MKIDTNNLNGIKPLRPGPASAAEQRESAKEVRDVFRKFVGEAFFGQMLKAMRSTQGKPAYFHGGHAEEVFQSQLDQVMSEKMTEASADQIADPMFRQQFPHQAALLAQGDKKTMLSLKDLPAWRRM